MCAEGEGIHLFEALALVGNGCVEDFLSELDEVFVLGNEVRFAFQGENGCKAVGRLNEHSAFGCFAVGTLGGYSLTFLADNFDGLFHVAVGFGKGLFAIAETGAGEGAQFLDIF